MLDCDHGHTENGAERRADRQPVDTCKPRFPSLTKEFATGFSPGTHVTTREGRKAVEDLAPGDLLLTRDRGFQPLLWRGMRRSRIPASGSDAAPVLINADALGNGQPERDLIVSPCHRLLSTDPELLAGTGEPEVLLEARTLAGRPGIGRICRDVVTYVHLLMAQHEVILAENAWSESFLLTPASAEALTVSGCGVSRDVLQGLRPGGQIPARLCPAALDMKAPVQA